MATVKELEEKLAEARAKESIDRQLSQIAEEGRVWKFWEDQAIAAAAADNVRLAEFKGLIVETASYDRQTDEITIRFVGGRELSFSGGGGDETTHLAWSAK